MKQKILSMTDDKHAEWYLRNFNVIGVEQRGKNDNWFYVVGKYEKSNQVNVLCIAKKGTGCKSSVFADLNYFAIVDAMEQLNYKVLWTRNSYPMWPVWYLDEERFMKFHAVWKSIISKYGFDTKTIWDNACAK